MRTLQTFLESSRDSEDRSSLFRAPHDSKVRGRRGGRRGKTVGVPGYDEERTRQYPRAGDESETTSGENGRRGISEKSGN